MAGQKDVTFGFDKYLNPKLLDRKATIANTIINALFMVPGNIPSMPTKGANIRQYFYKEESYLSSDKIRTDLEDCCGKSICGATLGNIDFSTQQTSEGDIIFVLIIAVKFSVNEQELLGIVMKQTKDSYVKFNFDYVPID